MTDPARPAAPAGPVDRGARRRPPERYGDAPTPVAKVALGVLAGLLAAVVLGAVWAGVRAATPDVRAGLLGYQVVDDSSVEVTVQVVRDPARPVRCSLRAQNTDDVTVGTAEVDVPTGGAKERTLRAVVATSERAVNGELVGCEVTDRSR